MTRYKIVVIDLDDEAKTRVKSAIFEGTEDDVQAVWDEVDTALHLIRSFGRKQDGLSVAKRHEKALKALRNSTEHLGKLRDLE